MQSLVRTFVATRGRDSVLDLGYLNDNHPELARAVVQRASGPGGGESEPVMSSHPSATKGQRQRVRGLLTLHGGNVSKVATEMGKPRAQVYRWMRLMGLSAESFRHSSQPTSTRSRSEWP